MDITVENIKRGSYINTVTKKFKQKFNTNRIKVNVKQAIASIHIEDTKRNEATKVLLDLNYPKTNSVQGFDSAKAQLFVARVIEKINK